MPQGSKNDAAEGLLGLDPARRFDAMRALRQHAPVHRLAPGGPIYLSRRSGVARALPRIEHFGGGVGAADVAPDHQALNGMAEPRHGRVRKTVNGLIGPHHLDPVRPFLERFCAEKLDALARADEPVDAMADFVDHVPASAITFLLGWDTADALQLYRWTVEICERAMDMKPGNDGTLTAIHPVFAKYVDERVQARLEAPAEDWPDDGLTRLLRGGSDGTGEALSPVAARTNLMFLLGAGAETTRDMLGGLLYELARDPDLYARLRADRSLVAAARDEALRVYSPTQFMVRRCERAIEIDGVAIEAGDVVYIGLASANRDERHFPEPDRFDVDRPNAHTHLAFGQGPHVCPGRTLVKLETEIAIGALLDRFAAIELAEGPDFEPLDTPMFYGPKRLPLRFHPA